MTPDVSLIMPAWEPRPDWLQEAVRSALDEATCELELIVVDDGSAEPVAPLLDGIDDARVRVLRVEHGGPYAARNAGIAAAAGAYLRFVDSDDVVEPGSTGRLLSLARGDGPVLAYGATLMCDEDLEPGPVVTSADEGWVVESCLLGGFDVYVVSILFPRAVVDFAGPWAERGFPVSGDWDFVLRALEQAPVRNLGEVVTRYRRHRGSVTGTADVAAGAIAGRLVIDRYLDRHPEQRNSGLERRARLRLSIDRAEAHGSRGQYRMAAGELRDAARWSPAAALGAAVRFAGRRLRGLSGRAARRARRSPRPRA